MKQFKAILFVILVLGCKKQSETGAASLGDLQQDALLSYKNHNPTLIEARLYLIGSPPEIKAVSLDHIRRSLSQNKLENIQVYATNFFTGYMEMEFKGRQTKWLQQPSHFIVVEGTFPNSNTNLVDGSFESYLAVAKINSAWWIVGQTYGQ